MDAKLQNLLDEREITRGLSLAARVADQRRYSDLPLVFAEDVIFDFGGGGGGRGIAALHKLMAGFLELCGGTQHFLGGILVDVENDKATSSIYVQARHQRPNVPLGPIFDVNGEYRDLWERRPEGWRIVQRNAIWSTHSGDASILSAPAVEA